MSKAQFTDRLQRGIHVGGMEKTERRGGNSHKAQRAAEHGLFAEPPVQRLSELLGRIKSVIDGTFEDTCWVVAEIAEVRMNQRGHCYLALVEKQGDETIAQIRATIWSYAYRSLAAQFERATGEVLRQGMKVLVLAEVTFHTVHGLSLNIRDLDPSYTMGEMARRKRETIERLTREGLIDLNKGLDLPLVPQRIAVVSSPTAAGYGDFTNHLRNNPYGYGFSFRLFSAVMQGPEAEHSIGAALGKVAARAGIYDLVVLVRGGGSQVDLNCFDSYSLAAEVARFPLPVITGIGHDRDETVVDMVAHTRCKTPTDVAQFIISGVRDFEERLLDGQRRVGRSAERALREQRHRLTAALKDFRHHAMQSLGAVRRRLDAAQLRLTAAPGAALLRKTDESRSLQKDIEKAVKETVLRQGTRLEKLEQAVRHLDPVNVLRRGYSITSLGGRPLVSAEGIKKGTVVRTVLYRGWITSTVEESGDGQA